MTFISFPAATPVALSALLLVTTATPSPAAALPRVESNGRVVVLDDFEHGLDAWDGDARVEIGPGQAAGSKALAWHCTDVGTTLRYKLADRIPEPAKYTRIVVTMRAWDDEGRQGPGVATYSHLTWGGLPWQLTDCPPVWGLWDRRPVFGDAWRTVAYHTRYPEWYNFTVKCDNTKPNLSLCANAMFAMSATWVIDDIRLVADPVEVLGKESGGVWGDGRWLPNGDFRYDYTIRLRNLTAARQTVRAKPAGTTLARFRGGIATTTLELAPAAEGEVRAWVEVPRERLQELPDLSHEELLVEIAVDGAPGTEQIVPLLATKPLPEVTHPFILHPLAWWVAERAKFAALSAADRTKALAPADALLARDLTFPNQPTVSTKKRINDGTDVEVPGWAEADQKTFEANWRALRTLGEAYQRTLDERYAGRAAAMLADFAGKYANYPWHGNYEISDQGQARIAMNSLHESYWITNLVGSCDLVWASPALAPELKQRLVREFLLPAGRHQTTVCSSFTNMTSTRFTAGALCGFLAGDANLVQYAVYGHHGLAISAQVSISADGFCTEIPINYHWANLREMLRLPLVCRNAGLKIDVAADRLRRACDSAYQRAMPNLNAPPFGCCGYGTGANFNLGDYPAAFDLFGDETYQRLGDPAETRKIVDALPSVVFPEGGMVVLREKGRAGPDRTYLAILSANRRRVPDGTLSLVLYADGALLCPSPGTLYNAHGDATWVSPWTSTLFVDGQPQRPCWGKVLAHDFGGDAQMALLDAGGIYDGVSLQRAVALAKGLVFVVDRVRSATPHTYERVQLVSQQIARAPAEKTDLERNEGEHIRFRGTRLDDAWSMQWRMDKGPSLELAMAGAPGTEVFWGENQVNGFKPQMLAPTVLVRRQGKATVFLTVMEPCRDGSPRLQTVRRVPVLVGQREASDAEAIAAEAVTSAGSVVFVVNFDGSLKTCQGREIKTPLAVLTR